MSSCCGFCRQTIVTGILLSVIAVFATGCCRPSMQAFTVNLEVDPAVRQSFTMDIVGLRPGDDDLRHASVGEYFRPGSELRSDVRHRAWTVNVPAGGMTQREAVVERNDAKWSQLRAEGVMELMVIVNRLNADNYEVGGTDTRRRVVTLDRCRWRKHGNQINIRAQRSRLDFTPQPDPPK